MTLNDLHDYLRKQYGAEGTKEYREDPGILVFARPDNGKWFAATKNIRCSSVDVAGDGRIDILNVRLDPGVVASLRKREGFRPAWHMNRNKWITVLLDGSVTDDEIRDLVDKAFAYMR